MICSSGMTKPLTLNKFTEEFQCKQCGRMFIIWKNYKDKTSYCSKKCQSVSYKTKMLGKNNPFYGKKHKKESLKAMSETHIGKPSWNKGFIGYKAGKEHYNWKGGSAGYSAIHKWVKKYFGTPSVCEHCSSTKSVIWANMDHKYTRDRNTWKQLCSKCHQAFDRVNGWGIATKMFNL